MVDQETKNLEAVEKGLGRMLPKPKSFAPPTERGIHELMAEAIAAIDLARRAVEVAKERLEHFDRLQANFYNGQAPQS
jgi:hypothetical protein